MEKDQVIIGVTQVEVIGAERRLIFGALQEYNSTYNKNIVLSDADKKALEVVLQAAIHSIDKRHALGLITQSERHTFIHNDLFLKLQEMFGR